MNIVRKLKNLLDLKKCKKDINVEKELSIYDKEFLNATHFGIISTVLQLEEECAELIQACSKLNRVKGYGQPTDITYDSVIESLIEEMADVTICIDELEYLLELNEKIQNIKEVKVNKIYNSYNH